MTTYREILEPIVGADALREAEARVYDIPAPDNAPGRYMCRDGFCALGIVGREMYQSQSRDRVPHFPCADDVVDYGLYGHAAWWAADAIVTDNDAGYLATPGSLTTLLAREV